MTKHSSNFKVLTEFAVEYAPTNVKKWRSSATGLQLTVVSQKSPMVYGYFAVATEIANDSGSPHTLEHLIFMGSKKYPYKGLLDTLSNLNASSTNAWTDQDRTVYTLETAGWQGFAKILPVYLDHIINPTLTEEACYTEVYHVDGEGKDKGVVYSEMEAIETSELFLSDLEASRTTYAENSGYSSETGGLLERLRELKREEIQQFHRDMYRPDNLCVIVIGSVNEKEFLDIMIEFDSTLPRLPEIPNPRPFVDSANSIILSENITKEIEFPDTEESTANITISWIGCELFDNVINLAILLILEYLTDSPVALLNHELVEIDNPYAYSISSARSNYAKIDFKIYVDGIPLEKVDECKTKLFGILESHVKNHQFDLERMRLEIELFKASYLYSIEESPNSYADDVINEFIYGNPDGSDLNVLKDLSDFEAIASWDSQQWEKLIDKYILSNPHVTVIARPSKKLANEKSALDEERVEARKKDLGAEGLKKLEQRLKAAEKQNDLEVPNEMIESIGIADLSDVNFNKTIPIFTGKPQWNKDLNPELHQQVFKDLPSNFPIDIYFNQYHSNFLSIQMGFSSFVIPEKLLPYMVVFQRLFSNPMKLDDGTMISHEDVVNGIRKDLVSYQFKNRFAGFGEMLGLNLACKVEKYEQAIDWAGKVFYNTVFDLARVKVGVEGLLNSLPETKREGSIMLAHLTNKHLSTNRSLAKSYNLLEIEDFYRNMLENLNTEEGFIEVREALETIQHLLFNDINNMRFYIVGDIAKLHSPVQAWEPFLRRLSKKIGNNLDKRQELIPIPRTYQALNQEGLHKGHNAYLLGTPGSESAYINALATLDGDGLVEAHPGILLVNSYLDKTEGPLWKAVRGSGLAYGADMYVGKEEREIYLSLYRSTDVISGFLAAKKVVDELASGKVKFDEFGIDGAISTLVGMTARSNESYVQSSMSTYGNVLRKKGLNYDTELFKKMKKLKPEDLVGIINKYIVPIFEPETSSLFLTLNPKNEGVVAEFKKLGYNVHYSLLEDSESDSEEDSEEESEGSGSEIEED